MINLENCRWKEFWLSDIFSIDSTSSSIDRKNLNGKPGNYPYITRTDKNNGYDDFVSEQSNYCKDGGNVITIDLTRKRRFINNPSFIQVKIYKYCEAKISINILQCL